MQSLVSFFRKIPKEIRYILLLFLISRIILTLIGVVSRIILEPYHGHEYNWVYSKHLWLDIWGVWDSGWYLSIAQNGYSASLSPISDTLNQGNFAFFPLYPILMKILGVAIGNYFVAGIILSNIFLIIACIFLYRLVRLESDENTALNSVKYLFLFPTAFILSGVFTESLFLALAIACFYYARKNRWFTVGVLGFLLSLTRFLGVFIILPLLFQYLREKKFKLGKIRINILSLLLIPGGLLTFAVYNRYLTGDFGAFFTVQSAQFWGRSLDNPLKVLLEGFSSPDVNILFSSYFTLVALAVLILFLKKISPPLILFSLYAILIPLSTGIFSMPRYILVSFPLFIILAKISQNGYLNQAITVFLALLQGFLMVFWANGFRLIM